MLTGSQRTRTFPRGLMFHRFRRSADPAAWQGALTASEFESVLLNIGIEHILSPAEWMDRLAAGRLEEMHVCVTFDDALRCQYDVALPVLEKYGLTAFWFIYSCVFDGIPVHAEVYSYVAGQVGGMEQLIERFLSRCTEAARPQLASDDYQVYAARMRREAPYYSEADIAYRYLRNQPANAVWFEPLMAGLIAEYGFEVRAVAQDLWLRNDHLRDLVEAGHEVGLHSYDHPYDIASLSAAEQRRQYQANAAHIQAITGRAPRSAAHPLNSYSRVTLEVLGELGVSCGFRANLYPSAGQSMNGSALELAREDSSLLLKEIVRE